MTTDIRCPKCASQNVIFSKKRNACVCEDCGHLLPEAPVSPLRIFLSYGHDTNEELVRHIKADLEKRGHDVWFDKNEIKFGDNWRREITDGILKSSRVLSFLSKHSTRDPGVCRDEIAIAIGVKGGNIQTVLVESEADVQPPVNISHIQWLDMHDWKERRAAGDPAWEEWYQSKLAEIIRVIESDESRRFAGEIETLHGHLKPIKSDARIYELLKKGFFGQWLFDEIETWRNSKTKIGVPLLLDHRRPRRGQERLCRPTHPHPLRRLHRRVIRRMRQARPPRRPTCRPQPRLPTRHAPARHEGKVELRMKKDEPNLRDRTKAFALAIIGYFGKLPRGTEAQVLSRQVLRSRTSVGANYREAYRARSEAEFRAKCGDSLKELEETTYWLELLSESHLGPADDLTRISQECNELTAIFVTILKNSKDDEHDSSS